MSDDLFQRSLAAFRRQTAQSGAAPAIAFPKVLSPRRRPLLLPALVVALAVGAGGAVAEVPRLLGEREAEVEGQVVVAGAGPVAEAKLELVDARRGLADWTDTDARGRFRIPPVPLGNYILKTSAPGFEPNERPLVLGRSARQVLVRLTPASTTGRASGGRPAN